MAIEEGLRGLFKEGKFFGQTLYRTAGQVLPYIPSGFPVAMIGLRNFTENTLAAAPKKDLVTALMANTAIVLSSVRI